MSTLKPAPASRHLLFWPLAFAGLAVDLGTKRYMFSQPELLAGNVWWVWQDHAGFQLSLNEGALFGMGQGGVWVFAACSLVAAVAIPLWLFAFGGARDAWITAVLGGIMGGVLGNMYDRVGLPGLDWGQFHPDRAGERVYAVRDFILWAWRWDDDWRKRVSWPNFNVADALLVCGAASIILLSFRRAPSNAPPDRSND
jgi:signal peptidase II